MMEGRFAPDTAYMGTDKEGNVERGFCSTTTTTTLHATNTLAHVCKPAIVDRIEPLSTPAATFSTDNHKPTMIGHMLWHEPPPIEWFSNKKPQTHTTEIQRYRTALELAFAEDRATCIANQKKHPVLLRMLRLWRPSSTGLPLDDDVIHHVLGVAYPIIPLDQFYKIETVFKFETTLTLKCVAPVFKALDIRGLVFACDGGCSGRPHIYKGYIEHYFVASKEDEDIASEIQRILNSNPEREVATFYRPNDTQEHIAHTLEFLRQPLKGGMPRRDKGMEAARTKGMEAALAASAARKLNCRRG